MEYALVRNGLVENVIIADAAFIAEHGASLAGAGGEWVALDDAKKVNGQRPSPGWSYSSSTKKFSRP